MKTNPSYFKGCPNCPVEQVSWDDVQNFISKLNAQNDGFKYRLPSEAEGEYAARAGTTGVFYGNLDLIAWYAQDYYGELDSIAWYDNNSDRKTHPVATKEPNAWGLYDMYGNVLEWCQDGPINSAGATSGSYRFYRGGSWNATFMDLGSSVHGYYAPSIRNASLGFRLLRQ